MPAWLHCKIGLLVMGTDDLDFILFFFFSFWVLIHQRLSNNSSGSIAVQEFFFLKHNKGLVQARFILTPQVSILRPQSITTKQPGPDYGYSNGGQWIALIGVNPQDTWHIFPMNHPLPLSGEPKHILNALISLFIPYRLDSWSWECRYSCESVAFSPLLFLL